MIVSGEFGAALAASPQYRARAAQIARVMPAAPATRPGAQGSDQGTTLWRPQGEAALRASVEDGEVAKEGSVAVTSADTDLRDAAAAYAEMARRRRVETALRINPLAEVERIGATAPPTAMQVALGGPTNQTLPRLDIAV